MTTQLHDYVLLLHQSSLLLILASLHCYMFNFMIDYSLASPPPVQVSQNPEDKHGGYGDSVTTLLKHHLITIYNLE